MTLSPLSPDNLTLKCKLAEATNSLDSLGSTSMEFTDTELRKSTRMHMAFIVLTCYEC